MPLRNNVAGIGFRPWLLLIVSSLIFTALSSCGHQNSRNRDRSNSENSATTSDDHNTSDISKNFSDLLVSPSNPKPGEVFRVLAVHGKSIRYAKISVHGQSGVIESRKSKYGDGFPFWRIDEFVAGSPGKYVVTLTTNKKDVANREFVIPASPASQASAGPPKDRRSWGVETEALYSAWINALFHDADERSSWGALHEVMQNRDRNFFYNYRSLGEDDPVGKITIIMKPDCADNPFYLRAYFSWKLGLPFGYHECDRGGLGRVPKTGRWIHQ